MNICPSSNYRYSGVSADLLTMHMIYIYSGILLGASQVADRNKTHYFSPCSVSFVLSGEYIQYSPLINFRLIIPSNIHLQLIIPSNIHLQCLCSTKNEKKTTSRRKFGIENYFYSESLTQPRNVKNKYVILRHLGDMCLFTSALRASVNKSHIPSLPQNNLYISLS